MASGNVNNAAIDSSDFKKKGQGRAPMDIEQRISPTPFSEEEVSARGMSTSEKKAV